MADTTEVEEVKTEKRFDLEKMEYVEVPVKSEEKPTEETTEEKKTEEVETSTDDPEKKGEESTEEKKEEEKKEETPDPEKKEEPKDDDPIEADAYIKEQYGQFGVNTEAELVQTLEDMQAVMAENDDLKKKLAAKENAEPVFKSENHKKLAKFLGDLPDISLADDRTLTFIRLHKIDTEKDDAKTILQEAFVLDNPDLSREDAIAKHNRDYNRLYTLKREAFDGTDEEFKEEERMRKIDEKAAVSKAKKAIAAKQAEFKIEEPAKDKTPKENPEVKASIEKISSSFDTAMKNFKGLVFEPENKKEDPIHVVLSKEQHAEVVKIVKDWVSNPLSYTAEGKLLSRTTDPNGIYKMAAYGRFGDEISKKLIAQAKTNKTILDASEIAKKETDRKAKSAGDNPISQMSEEKQQERLIAQKKAQRAKQQGQVYK